MPSLADKIKNQGASKRKFGKLNHKEPFNHYAKDVNIQKKRFPAREKEIKFDNSLIQKDQRTTRFQSQQLIENIANNTLLKDIIKL